ncbi:universal stress protein [Streptomyces sp. NPDC059708]|uniref:universal stress protein n=1 Tax=Streptomyces sp. NPDC059708 TaxID=3346916 RepID=UPI0036CEB34B
MSKRIVAGLDGSDASLAAADWAAREAELHGARLELVHVDDWPVNAPFAVPPAASRRQWSDGLLAGSRDRILLRHPALEVATRRIDGRAAAEGLTYAAGNADMLVLGTRGLGSLAGFLVGSVGSAAVPTTVTPVVLVRPADREAPPVQGDAGTVVLGLDPRSDCEPLLGFACEEADRRGRPLVVVHAWPSPPAFAHALVMGQGLAQEITDASAKELSELLAPWQQKYPRLAVEPRVVIGQPAVQVLDAAVGASLVVVGRRIRRSAIGTHIGAITHAVMHHAASPVAVVAHD